MSVDPAASAIINDLRLRTLERATFATETDDYVLPDYRGRSLANVPATLAALLGAELGQASPPLLPEYWQHLAGQRRQIVFVLLDALGWQQLQRVFEAGQGGALSELAAQGTFLPMTSVFPSTTAAALATVASGVTPIAHGMLGYELWLREYGVLAEMLAMKPAFAPPGGTLLDWGLVPEQFLSAPAVGAQLRAQGVTTTALLYEQYAQSGLTRTCYRGMNVAGYASIDDMWAQAASLAARRERQLIYVYWGGIDAAAHRHGYAGDHWLQAYEHVAAGFEKQFLAGIDRGTRDDTLLIVVADHGFVESPAELAFTTDQCPAWERELIVPFSGEARAAFLHAWGGAQESTGRRLQDILGDGHLVVPAEELVALGLFGDQTPGPESLTRIGHYVALARGEHHLDRRGRRDVLRGLHGGLTSDEMLIPWIAAPL